MIRIKATPEECAEYERAIADEFLAMNRRLFERFADGTVTRAGVYLKIITTQLGIIDPLLTAQILEGFASQMRQIRVKDQKNLEAAAKRTSDHVQKLSQVCDLMFGKIEGTA
jgi:hypothetical protein